MDWSGVDYCDVFISCLDSHSDGTHSLQRIHWWDTMLHFWKKLIYVLEGHFGWTAPLTSNLIGLWLFMDVYGLQYLM